MKTLGRSMKRPPIGDGVTKTDPAAVLAALKTSHTPVDTIVHHQITYLPHHQISPNPDQPRRHFDDEALEDLAESIRSADGILEPLLVRKRAANRYEIIAGERRWRAAAIIDLHELPCIIRNDLDYQQILVLSLIENIQRRDLNPIEEARGIQRLINEFGLSHLDAANAVGRSRSAVSNMLRLLDVDPLVQDAILAGDIEAGHARALAALEPKKQRDILKTTIAQQWSVRQVEAAVRRERLTGPDDGADDFPTHLQSDLRRIEEALTDQLGYLPAIKLSANGAATLRVKTLNDLKKLVQK